MTIGPPLNDRPALATLILPSHALAVVTAADEHRGPTEASGDLRFERVVFFSDAVFAIAATLLVIDLRPPSALVGDYDLALQTYFSNASPFIAIAIGFLVVGSYWMSHRAIFALIRRTDGLLIWMNLVFLFWVAIQPFFTAALAERATRTSVIAYAACQVFAGIAQLGLWAAALRNRDLLIPSLTPHKVRYVTLLLVRAPISFALSIPVALLAGPVPAMATWALILVLALATQLAFRDLRRWTADSPATRGGHPNIRTGDQPT